MSKGWGSLNVSKDKVLETITSDIDEAESLIRRMDELKQILQFEERWQNLIQNAQNSEYTNDVESNRETWALMERFQDMIVNIPQQPVKYRLLVLDFKPLYDQISKIPRRVIQQIERRVVTSLETDTQALKQDLSKAYEILQQNPTTLNIYVE